LSGYTTNIYGAPLTGSDTSFPCGTSGRIYNLFRPEIKSFSIKLSSTAITIRKTGIAWSSDIGKHKDYDLNKQPFSLLEEDWLVWYRPAARSDFYKLFGVLENGLIAGNYTFYFKNGKYFSNCSLKRKIRRKMVPLKQVELRGQS
jgi:hypothetical protein